MKKKLIYGLAMIGASAAVLGGCGGIAGTTEIENTVTDNQKVGFENNVLTTEVENADPIEITSETTTADTTTIETTTPEVLTTTVAESEVVRFIDRVEAWDIQGNEAGYTVYLKSDCKWDDLGIGTQEEISHEAIKMCIKKMKEDGVTHFSVDATRNDGDMVGMPAFVWSGNISDKIKYFEGMKKSYELGLYDEQLKEWGY